MFEFTETIGIQAPASVVWEVLHDVENWWPASNPEHESLERLDDRDVLDVGAQLRIREKIAGIPGEAIGTITRVEPGTAVTWETTDARYRWLGIPVSVGEGVTWRVEARSDATNLSAHVWARFRPGLSGRIIEAVFTHVLHGVARDREHTRIELRYLKRIIEPATPRCDRRLSPDAARVWPRPSDRRLRHRDHRVAVHRLYRTRLIRPGNDAVR